MVTNNRGDLFKKHFALFLSILVGPLSCLKHHILDEVVRKVECEVLTREMCVRMLNGHQGTQSAIVVFRGIQNNILNTTKAISWGGGSPVPLRLRLWPLLMLLLLKRTRRLLSLQLKRITPLPVL